MSWAGKMCTCGHRYSSHTFEECVGRMCEVEDCPCCDFKEAPANRTPGGATGTCIRPLCTEPKVAKHLCHTHYWRTRRGVDLAKPIAPQARKRKDVAPRKYTVTYRPRRATWELMKAFMERTGLGKNELVDLALEEWAYRQRNDGLLPGSPRERDRV